ncbi:MAG TPA: M20 family metallo-hydrolase [Bryobacteraceae bacterium]|jgi:N-carbamoyl-L-amino-acid hydrolase|nr:M20 family metallo-hydrolase [Bryobacteraceae bacterium]
MKLTIDTAKLIGELDTLSSFSDTPAPAVTRIVFSDADLGARAWLKGLYREAGLTVREDAVGNTFARFEGVEPDLAAVGTGSHTDAIPHSGRYDGTVGVLGGLEAIRALQRAGIKPRRSIELLMFTSEEPTRFGIGCLGSRLLAGTLDPSAGQTLRDSEGNTLDHVRTHAGFEGSLTEVALQPNYYSAFAELHIEQGPLLERRSVPLGVVRAIAAPASVRVTVHGQGGHAGAVLMPDRHDAFMAAAEIALALEAAAKSTGAIDSVATTGVCEVFPGAVNSIPSRVRLAMDIRDIDEARRDGMLADLDRVCNEISQRRGVTTQTEIINRDAPAACDPSVVAALNAACRTHGLAFDSMVSRAYHDSLFMSRICPAAMLFIPCRDGVSHRPDEYAAPEAIEQGTLVLAEALANLAA